MILRVNQKTKTPLGDGVVQGEFSVTDAHGQVVGQRVLVRMPVNDVTKVHLRKSNCLTPVASTSGLWTFNESELSL